MKMKHVTLAIALLSASLANESTAATTILSDNYTASNVGSGFALGEGVNSGINPPTSRITGTAAANLRYLQTDTRKPGTVYDISSNRLRIQKDAGIGRFSLSANGAIPFDFGPAIGATFASPTNQALYDVKVSMRNDATTAARFSFGLSTADAAVGSLDFAVQLYRTSSTVSSYTIRKRIDAASSGTAAIDVVMGTTAAGTTNSMIPFLIRVNDSGMETNTFSSRIQVSIDNGATWIYDTSTDPDLPNGFRFDGVTRYLVFDQAGNSSGTVFYDSLSIVSTYSPAPPEARIWTGAGADDNWSTLENWGGAAPSGGEPIVFDGTTRQANFNDLTDLNVLSVTFNNGGFSLSGNPFSVSSTISNAAGVNTFAGDFSFSATGAKTWSIANGSEIVLNNTTTLEVGGDNGLFGGGTLHGKGTMNIGQVTTANPAFVVFEGRHLVDGGTFASRGGYRIGSQSFGVGAETILTNGANFSLTLAGANLRVGDSANPIASRLVIDNSTLTMTGGSLGVGYAAGATGEVVQNGGTVSGGTINFNQAGAGVGTYTIKNGTLAPVQIKENTAAGQSAIYFDNAVLRSIGTPSAAFFSGVDVAEIQSGGLTLDAQVDVTIDQILSGSGQLVKSGSATATLTGANLYSGGTLVQSGRLVFPNDRTNSTAVQVASTAGLGVLVRVPGSTLALSSVALGSPSSLNFDLAAFGTPTAPLLKVSSLSVSGLVTINVANGVQLSTNQIVLVDYDGALVGGFNFTIGSLPPGVTATLVNNTANSSVDLKITGVPGYRWAGTVSSAWNGGDQNWINLQTGSPTTFADGFPTEFLDGAATGNVNASDFVSPSIISVSNNSLPYVWSGTGIITPVLKKSGTNSLTRIDGAADTITVIELNQGSYVANDSSDTTLAANLTDTSAGEGTFMKQGASILTLTSTNTTFDGKIVVQQGTLKLSSTNSPLGTTNGSTTIASGATLDLNDIIAPGEPVFVSGQGVNGLGAIIDSATGGAVANNLTDVTLTGDTTFGSSGRWDLRMRGATGIAPGLRGNGFNLTKVGSGSTSIAAERDFGVNGPYWNMNLGDVFVNEGSLTFAESLGLGNPAKIIAIAPGATLGTYNLSATNPIVRNIFMTNATMTGSGGSGDTNVFTGAIQLTGANHLRPIDTKLIINGALVGSGSLNVSATGGGTLYLNGVNTYPGVTTVTNGILGGSGVIAGNLLMLDGTTAPGMGIGTLTVNGSATLAGTTLMELNRSLSPNSDRLVVGGSLNFGGALTVVLAVGAPSPQAGDVYQLFNKGGSGTFSPITLPNLSALPGGLAWDTSKLSVNGSITVTGTATPPTIGSVGMSGNNFVFSGTGGVEGGTYKVLSSTNIALPVANWTPVATNQFGQGGSFSYTNVVNPATPATFFLLQVP